MLDASTDALRGVGLSRSQILVNSVNPTRSGHKVYADIIAYAMQQTLAEELRGLISASANNANGLQVASSSEEPYSALVQQLLQQLPPPVSALAADEADQDPLCAMDQGFPAAVSVSKNTSWTWGTDGSLAACPHDHCRVWGYRWGPCSSAKREIARPKVRTS
jgi:hypothetical protein